ncbi:MAG: cytidylate kinase [Litorivivens sp.]
MKINIAIDGHSSCGKSTLAKELARQLNYVYVDTGAMYRAMALYALQGGFIKKGELDGEGLIHSLDNVYISFKYNPDSRNSETFLNAANVEKEIRSMQVSNFVSAVSELKEVRAKLVRLQKRLAEFGGVVMDGRDIGTVVMPNAELKFFMTADDVVRAQRRFDELQSKGIESTLQEVVHNITTRDNTDSNRVNDPLRKSEDAIIIDNTHLTQEEQFDFAMSHIRKAIESVEKKTEVEPKVAE